MATHVKLKTTEIDYRVRTMGHTHALVKRKSKTRAAWDVCTTGLADKLAAAKHQFERKAKVLDPSAEYVFRVVELSEVVGQKERMK